MSPACYMVTIAELPVKILLEIFNFYRQNFKFECQCSYDRDWNNKNGWFELAHVCHRGQSVVLTFSSRLQLWLFFEAKTPKRAAVLTALSSLPIVVDYCCQLFWNVTLQNCLTSALRYPHRVYKIALSVTYTNRDVIHKALGFTFPILESLELYGISIAQIGTTTAARTFTSCLGQSWPQEAQLALGRWLWLLTGITPSDPITHLCCHTVSQGFLNLRSGWYIHTHDKSSNTTHHTLPFL
jgi:hypothetical protein